MSTRRFFAYLGLACWLVLTPISLWTGQQWIEQSTQSEIFSQQTRADGPDPRAVKAFSVAEKRRQEFWHELAAWIVLTIATSALLAEHRQYAQHAHERLHDRVPERISERS
ncbi:MAG TPA: hypothetical protein VFW94_09470 [Candidatus Acidoferrales bacterium]|nr:hypothetical protein [Candidatus Acidoferrales bacterium]